jgi:hypothetical protein
MDEQVFKEESGNVDTYILSDIEKDYIIRTLKAHRNIFTEDVLTLEQEEHVYNTIMHELGGE